MSCETYTTEIDGSEYAYTQLTAKKSLKLKFRIAGLMGSAIGDIMPAIGKSDEVQLRAFGNAIQDVFSKNNPDTVLKLIEDIFVPAFKDKTRIDIDEHFTGDTLNMYKVLFWVLKCEYEDFLNGINVAVE